MDNTTTTKEQKIYNLVIDLEKTKRDKKDTVKSYNEEIKRLQGEIKDLLNENNELN
jgi:hypothetical protein